MKDNFEIRLIVEDLIYIVIQIYVKNLQVEIKY